MRRTNREDNLRWCAAFFREQAENLDESHEDLSEAEREELRADLLAAALALESNLNFWEARQRMRH